MSVVSSIESIGPCRKRVHVEIPAPAVDAETSRVVREYGRKIRLPGFRKGKVPVELVRKRFHAEIDREVLDRLVPRYWKQAQAESSIEPLLPPSVDDVELKHGEPLTFVATVEVRPEVELKEIHDFDLPVIETEPQENEVDEALAGLQAQVADWVPAERAVARGDLVSIESVELDAEEREMGELQTLDVEVGSPQVWEELSLALTGLEAGQETDFRRQEESEGEARVRHFRVKVLAVKEKDLPPLDDDLAKQIGALETLEELRAHVRERLREEKERKARQEQEQAVLEQLRERHPLELPAGVIEEETRLLLQEYADSLSRQGVDVQNTPIDWESLAREIRPQAQRRVHVRLVLDAVADAEETTVAPEELEQRLAAIAKARGRTTTAVRQALAREGQLDALRRQMRREKTIDHLVAAGRAAPQD